MKSSKYLIRQGYFSWKPVNYIQPFGLLTTLEKAKGPMTIYNS